MENKTKIISFLIALTILASYTEVQERKAISDEIISSMKSEGLCI